MKKIILHIGRHKSGTTSLQHVFAHNVDEFKKHNVLYPDIGRRGKAHHQLSELLISKRKSSIEEICSSNLIQEFLAFIKQTKEDIVLISSEGFQNCNPEVIKTIFKEFELHVVFYVRKQDSYLESAFLQEVHSTTYAGTVEEFETEFPVDYLEFYRKWEQVIGQENIHVRIFNRKLLIGNDVVKDFFESIMKKSFNIDINYLAPSLNGFSRNSSLKGVYLPFKLRLNRTVKLTRSENDKMYRVLGILSHGVEDANSILKDNLQVKLKKKYLETNRQFLSEVGLDSRSLDFTENSRIYENYKDIGPIVFHRVLLQVISKESGLESLLDKLYFVEVSKFYGGVTVQFSKNLAEDSINRLFFEINGKVFKVTDVVIKKDNMLFVDNVNLNKDNFLCFLNLGDRNFDVKVLDKALS